MGFWLLLAFLLEGLQKDPVTQSHGKSTPKRREIHQRRGRCSGRHVFRAEGGDPDVFVRLLTGGDPRCLLFQPPQTDLQVGEDVHEADIRVVGARIG